MKRWRGWHACKVWRLDNCARWAQNMPWRFCSAACMLVVATLALTSIAVCNAPNSYACVGSHVATKQALVDHAVITNLAFVESKRAKQAISHWANNASAFAGTAALADTKDSVCIVILTRQRSLPYVSALVGSLLDGNGNEVAGDGNDALTARTELHMLNTQAPATAHTGLMRLNAQLGGRLRLHKAPNAAQVCESAAEGVRRWECALTEHYIAALRVCTQVRACFARPSVLCAFDR